MASAEMQGSSSFLSFYYGGSVLVPRRGLLRDGRMLLVAVLVLLSASACKVDVLVALDASSDGSGTIEVSATLDQEATVKTPNLAAQLRVEDLRATGWTVTGPTKTPSGSVMQASKRFASPEEASKVLDEVSGPDGPLSGMALRRDRTPLWWTWNFEGDLDLKDGIERFGDAVLREQLEGSSFGVSAQEAQDMFNISFGLRMPGQVDAKNAKNIDGYATWSASYGKRVPLAASSREVAIAREVAAGLAVAALIVFVLLWLTLRARLGRHTPFL